jgi:hypothetical protein
LTGEMARMPQSAAGHRRDGWRLGPHALGSLDLDRRRPVEAWRTGPMAGGRRRRSAKRDGRPGPGSAAGQDHEPEHRGPLRAATPGADQGRARIIPPSIGTIAPVT